MFKRLNLLKVDDIFTCQCMSFYHKYVNNHVPLFCKSLFTCNATHHDYHTRHNLQLVIPYSHTSRARKSVRYHLPSLLRSMPQCVSEKVHTHSLSGFSLYLKKHLLSQYNDSCSIVNCYIIALVWKNLVSHILVKIEFDQFLDLLGFALSLHAVTVQKYQQLSKILVWKNLVSHINFFFR